MKVRWFCQTGQHWVFEPIGKRCQACQKERDAFNTEARSPGGDEN